MTTATGDLVIRRCAVRVVRHGGWSWGPQPRRLVDQVLAALPGLIAERLAGLAPDGAADVEITEPVRIVVSLTLADLLAGRFDPLRHAAIAAEPLPESSPATGPARPQAPIRPNGSAFPARTPALDARAQPVTLAQFLAGLFECGELGQFLALLPADTLEAWYQWLTAPPAEAAGRRPWAAAFPALPAGRLPGGTGHPAAGVPAPSPGAAAAPETGRSRQLRDAIAAIAARASRPTPAHPPQPSDPAVGFDDRQPPAGVAAEPQPPPAPALARPQAPVQPGGTPPLDRTPALQARTQPVMTLAQFLARLFERGELGQFLALLPADTLEAWYQWLTAPPAEAPGTRPGTAGTHPGAAAFPALPAGRLPGGTGHPAAGVPAPSPGAAAAPETGRSRQLRDAIAAIAARASRQTPAHPLQPGDPAAGFHHREPPADAESAGPQPPHVGAGPAAAVTAAGTAPAKGDAASGQIATASGAVAPANAVSSPVSATGAGTASAREAAAARQIATTSGAVAPANAVSSPVSATGAGTASAREAAAARQIATTSGAGAPANVASVPVAATVADVASALPFLLLGPLAQTGYLSALTPALQAARP